MSATPARPLSRMRRAIAKVMTESAAIPQFAIELELDAHALIARREATRPRFSLTDVLVASCAASLRAHPDVNASYADAGIVQHDEVNVALAVALDDGLISPVVRAADRRGLDELAAERTRLTA
ncbi:MAG: 2-oxo acid dehydrogenase subunit E2, partial [Conexibacter sp.]